MNRKLLSLALAALLAATLLAGSALAEGVATTNVPSIDIGDVTPEPTATPSTTPPSVDIGDVTPTPEVTPEVTPVPTPIPTPVPAPAVPDDSDESDNGPTWGGDGDYYVPEFYLDVDEPDDSQTTEPQIAVIVTAEEAQQVSVESESAGLSVEIGDGLHSEAMAKAADALASKPLSDVLSEDTQAIMREMLGDVSLDAMYPVLNMPLTNIAVDLSAVEGDVTVTFDLSELMTGTNALEIGSETIGLVCTLHGDDVIYSPVPVDVSDAGKADVHFTADALENMTSATETLFSLLSD